MNFEKYGIKVQTFRNSGHIKVGCPECSGRHGKGDKPLSVDLKTGLFLCHRCGYKGCANEESEMSKLHREIIYNKMKERKVYNKPPQRELSADYDDKTLKYLNGRGLSKETLNKLKITNNTLKYRDGTQKNVIEFNYIKNGEVVNIKTRTGDKQFTLCGGAELLPYNIDCIDPEIISKLDDDDKSVIINEGELDTASIVECGFDRVVSVPNGASNNTSYLDDYMESHFDVLNTIYICVDSDRNGTTLKNELIRRFGGDRCKIVSYPDDCKDINEVLVKHGKEAVLKCIEDAEDIPVDGVHSASEYRQEAIHVLNGFENEGFRIGLDNFDENCRFDLGRLAVVTGYYGSGKSKFLDEMALRLNLLYNFKVAIFSPESAPYEKHLAEYVERITGKSRKENLTSMEINKAIDHFNDNFFWVDSSDENYHVDVILSKFKFLVKKRGIKVAIIDPFNYIEYDKTGSISETDAIRTLLLRFKKFAKANNILFFLMAHPSKGVRDKAGNLNRITLNDISGSAHFSNIADFGLVVTREQDERYVELYIDKVKIDSLGNNKTKCYFKFQYGTRRFIPIPDVEKLKEEGIDIKSIGWKPDKSNWLYDKLKANEKKAEDDAVINFVEYKSMNDGMSVDMWDENNAPF